MAGPRDSKRGERNTTNHRHRIVQACLFLLSLGLSIASLYLSAKSHLRHTELLTLHDILRNAIGINDHRGQGLIGTRWPNSIYAAAHFQLKAARTVRRQGGLRNKLDIQASAFKAPVQPDIQIGLTLNGVNIKQPGLYFVYSQVSFLQYHGGLSSSQPTFVHHVCRYNPLGLYPNDGTELLLRGATTKDDRGERFFSEYTSFTGALVFLNRNDELFVNVSDLTSVSHQQGGSYMGLFKV